MSEIKVYPVPEEWSRTAYTDGDKYLEMYDASIRNPEKFWGEHKKNREEDGGFDCLRLVLFICTAIQHRHRF